jgi:hypothetical protein
MHRVAICLGALALGALVFLPAIAASAPAGAKAPAVKPMDEAKAKDWLAKWDKRITDDARNRYCDKETGEEIGWLITPFLNGFYYGYLATGDTKWIDMLVDWSDSTIKRGTKEPDGYLGWPKAEGASTKSMPDFTTDNQLGEQMALRPIALLSAEILKTPALKAKYGAKAEAYLKLAEENFAKWEARGAWREVKEGGVWVVPPFGFDPKTGKFTDGYAERTKDGFSLPDNKQNAVALFHLAMFDVTKKPVYKDRAEKWFKVQKSRMKTREGGKYYVWDYWDPAGPWDYKPDGNTKHWVGVHPNGGYYSIDLEGIVAAYEHGLVFSKEEIDRLIATNRDYMWDQKIEGAKFKRIDGGEPDERWAKSPGVLWSALAPYDDTLRKIFEANHQPESWGGLSATPWYLSRFAPSLRGER